MRLLKLRPGMYTGEIKNYNIKKSDRTGRSYLNLIVTINVKIHKKDLQKSYCLDIGKNINIVRIMEDIDGLNADKEADFEKLYEYLFDVTVAYDKYRQIIVEELRVADEEEEV